MIIKNKKILNNILLLAVITTCCFSCETDLYETYKEYSDSDVVSIGSPDSLAVQSGFDKLLFKVFINADPKIKKGVITWNLGSNEKTFNIDRTIYQNEMVEVEIDIEEGSYEFSVHMEDVNGNSSNKMTIFTQVLGDVYSASLANRNIEETTIYSDSEVIVHWASNRRLQLDAAGNAVLDADGNEILLVVNNRLVKTEITYTSSADGTEKTIMVDESEEEIIISDFISEGTFSYITYYTVVVDSPYVFASNPTEGIFPVKI